MSVRSARAGTSAAAIVLAVALVAGVNYLGARHWARGDWTKTRLYSLSQTTKKTLASLTRPVQVSVFMPRGSALYQPVMELLNRYRTASSKIEVEEVDPERNRLRAEALVKQFGIRQNTIVFRSGDRKKYVEEDKLADLDYSGAQMGAAPQIKSFKGEEAFTSAILDVTENKVRKVYFSSGHGEPTLDSSERGRGFAQAKQTLERADLAVASWDSLGKGAVPADADVIVVAGPRAAFLEPEASALTRYAASGGRLLLLLDPVLPDPAAPPNDFGLGGFLATYGVKIPADIVIDPANAVPMVGPETLIANHYGPHPIVQALAEEGLPVVFPLARSVSAPQTPAAGYNVVKLVETTADGWGETSLNRLDAVSKDKDDVQGPVTIAVAIESANKNPNTGKATRVVVVGNSRFAANGSISNAGNTNLFLNAVNWLAGQERLVGIAPKTPEQASLALTRAQVNRIGLFTILGMPAFAIALGIWVWYRRRD